MKLVKKFHIAEVHATTYVNAPYTLILGHDPSRKCELIMDKDACKRHGIKSALKLVGRDLECTLTTRQVRRKKPPRGLGGSGYSFPDEQDKKVDEMWLEEIVRTERYLQYRIMASRKNQSLHREVTHILYTESGDESDGSHLAIHLTEEEYKKCIKLPIGTVLKAKFRLLPKEKPQQKEAKRKIRTKR